MRRTWAHLSRRVKSEEGFTLIELLVVLAILAIIAGVAIPRVMQTTANARATRDKAKIAIVQSAVERYHLDVDTWPVVSATDNHINFPLLGDYLSQVPEDPANWTLNATSHRVEHVTTP